MATTVGAIGGRLPPMQQIPLLLLHFSHQGVDGVRRRSALANGARRRAGSASLSFPQVGDPAELVEVGRDDFAQARNALLLLAVVRGQPLHPVDLLRGGRDGGPIRIEIGVFLR